MSTTDSMENRLASVRERISGACARAGRSPAEVTLLPVSKTFGVDAIRHAMALGLNRFGENKTQEIGQKAPQLSDSALSWVMIGHLQT
ncbi:MAG: YggS family pyridoxal phosphate-dependent enzyme, partial [Paralcaligenes sp.]